MAALTIPDEERRTRYAPVTSTTIFPVGFPVASLADVEVWVSGVPLAAGAFTVTAGALADGFYSGAVVTLNTGVTGTVDIVGKRAPSRVAQYVEGRGVTAREQNIAENLRTAVDRELFDATERSLQTRPGDVDGAGQFDARGNRIANVAAGSGALDAVNKTQLDAVLGNLPVDLANPNFRYSSDIAVATYANFNRAPSGLSSQRSYKPNGTITDVWSAGILNWTNPNSAQWTGWVGLTTSTAFAGQWVGGQPMDKFAFREGIDRFSVNGLSSLFEVNDIPDEIHGTVPTRDGSRTLAKAQWVSAGNGLGQTYGWPLGRNNIMPDGAFGGNDNTFGNSDVGLGFPSSIGKWIFLDSLGNENDTPTTGWAYIGGGGLRHTAGAGANVKARRRILLVPSGTVLSVVWTMANVTAGSVSVQVVGTGTAQNGSARSSDGTYTETITTSGVTEHIDILPASTTFAGDITSFYVDTGLWHAEGGWTRDATTGKFKHTPGAASKLWINFDFTLANAVRLHEIEVLLRTYVAGNVRVFFENSDATVSIPADANKPNDKSSSPARLYASPDAADGGTQTAAVTSTAKRILYLTCPEMVAGVEQVSRFVILASSDFEGSVEEVGAFVPRFGGGWNTSPRYGRADAIGHFMAQDATTFGRGGGTYFGSAGENGLTTKRNAWQISGRFVSAGLAGWKTAAVTYQTMLFAVPAQFTAVCSDFSNGEYAMAWVRGAGANALNTQDGLVAGLDSLVAKWSRLVDGTATKVMAINTANGDWTLGAADQVKFDQANKRVYGGLDSAAQVASNTAFLQLSTTGRSPLALSRTDAAAGARFISFVEAGTEVADISSDGAGTLTFTGWAGGHFIQPDGFDPRTAEVGVPLSISDAWCEWKVLEWTHPHTGELVREPYFGSMPVGRSFIDMVEIAPARSEDIIHEAAAAEVQAWLDGVAIYENAQQEAREARMRGEEPSGDLPDRPVMPASVKEGVVRKVETPAEVVAISKTVAAEPGGRTNKKAWLTAASRDKRAFGIFLGINDDGEPIHRGSGDCMAIVTGPVEVGDPLATFVDGEGRASLSAITEDENMSAVRLDAVRLGKAGESVPAGERRLALVYLRAS